jgi:hypothetical protein
MDFEQISNYFSNWVKPKRNKEKQVCNNNELSYSPF